MYGQFGLLQVTSSRITNAHMRNKQIYASHNIIVDADGVGDPNGDRLGIRWYQIAADTDATGKGKGCEKVDTPFTLIQAGTLWDSSNNPLYYNMPSIMTTKEGVLAICGTLSNSQTPTSAFFVGRLPSDDPGTLRVGSILSDIVYAQGSGVYSYSIGGIFGSAGFGQRFGDWSYTCYDPANVKTLWTVQEIFVNGIETFAVARLDS